jgi:hypothetical protein
VTRSTRPIATASISDGDHGERPSARWSRSSVDAVPDPRPRVTVVCERVQVVALRAAEHRLDDWKRVEELELAVGRNEQQPVGLRDGARDLREELLPGDPDRIGRPTRSRTARRSRSAISTGSPAIRRMPRTSRNASSIDSPSTNGEMSSKTLYAALLAAEYASIRGGTTIASGQRRQESTLERQ